jgi:hypothetical protein
MPRLPCLALVLTLAACGSAKPTADAGKDAKAETKPEAAVEAPADTQPDADAATPDADAAAPADADAAAPDADAAPPADADAAPFEGGDAPAESPGDAPVEVDPLCATIQKDATRTVHLRITADNECDVFVNGAEVGSTTNWQTPVTMDVSLYIYPGRVNVIGVFGRNTSSQGGNDRGIIGELDDLTDGGSKVVMTDNSWKSSKIERSGWPAVLYDDSGWDQATEIANHGDGPWGALLGTTTAKWLWSAAVPNDVAAKPNAESAFFRKAFYFGTDGSTVIDKPACPVVGP